MALFIKYIFCFSRNHADHLLSKYIIPIFIFLLTILLKWFKTSSRISFKTNFYFVFYSLLIFHIMGGNIGIIQQCRPFFFILLHSHSSYRFGKHNWFLFKKKNYQVKKRSRVASTSLMFTPPYKGAINISLFGTYSCKEEKIFYSLKTCQKKIIIL